MNELDAVRSNPDTMDQLATMGLTWLVGSERWDAAVNAEAAKYHENACSYHRQLSEALILISRVQAAPVRQGSADGRAFVYVEDLEIALEGLQ